MFDLGETLTATARMFTRGNAEINALSHGLTESGLPWVIRILARFISGELQKATPDQLHFLAAKARELADRLDDVL